MRSYKLEMDIHNLNVVVHIVAGSCALLVGLVPLFAAKGGSVHKSWGRAFVWITSINLLTAILGSIFFDSPGPLVAATMSAVYQYLSSLRALALKGTGPGWIDALLALVGICAGVLLLSRISQSSASWTPAIGYSVLGYAVAVAVYDLSRHFWSTKWLAKARLLDHGVKMTGAYFAMMSAGFGNVFRSWQPYSQFGPSVLGTLVTIAFIVRYRSIQSVTQPESPLRST